MEREVPSIISVPLMLPVFKPDQESVLTERSYCTSDEDFQIASELAKNLVALLDKSRKNGILSLDEEFQKKKSSYPFLLRRGLFLILRGTDPEYVRQITELYILTGDYRERALLERLLIMDALSAIQVETNPVSLARKWEIHFGDSFGDRVITELGLHTGFDFKDFLNRLWDRPAFSNNTTLIDNFHRENEDYEYQRFLWDYIDKPEHREIIVKVLYGCQGGTAAELIQSFMNDDRADIGEKIDKCDADETEIIAAQKIFLEYWENKKAEYAREEGGALL